MNNISHFHRQMREVKEDLLMMAGLVEESIHEAVDSLTGRDKVQASEVIDTDNRIDLMQNQIEERVFALMATQQPVASDLRFLSAAIKIASHLERMGDQAVNLAERTLVLAEMEPVDTPRRLVAMGELAREMTCLCLDAFVQNNVDLARSVIKRDDELDDLNLHILEDMVEWMTRERRVIRRGVEIILAARHLERVGDEATNIGEEVVFLVEGEIIRHKGPDAESDSVGPL
jgi:phosphate transport system protein